MLLTYVIREIFHQICKSLKNTNKLTILYTQQILISSRWNRYNKTNSTKFPHCATTNISCEVQENV